MNQSYFFKGWIKGLNFCLPIQIHTYQYVTCGISNINTTITLNWCCDYLVEYNDLQKISISNSRHSHRFLDTFVMYEVLFLYTRSKFELLVKSPELHRKV